MDYRPDFERAALMLAVSMLIFIPSLTVLGVASVRGELPLVLFQIGLVAALFLCFLPAAIVLFHLSSYFRIEAGRFIHLRFARCTRSIPLGELASVDVVMGVMPGRFTFRDGTEIRVSGMALGKDGGLSKVLREACPDVRLAGLS